MDSTIEAPVHDVIHDDVKLGTSDSKAKNDRDRNRNNNHNNKNNRQNQNQNKSKKRPRQEARVAPTLRMCFSIEKGISCSIRDTCPYEHDPMILLASKPADIGPVCYQYETYGLCANGLTCRFGSSHIDMATGTNLSRPIELGGVVDRPRVNILSKELQTILRKKKYTGPIKSAANTSSSSSSSTMVTSLEAPSSSIIAATTEIVATYAVPDPVEGVTEVVSTATETVINGSDQPATSTTAPTISHKPKLTSLSAYDNYVKLVDFSNKVYKYIDTTIFLTYLM